MSAYLESLPSSEVTTVHPRLRGAIGVVFDVMTGTNHERRFPGAGIFQTPLGARPQQPLLSPSFISWRQSKRDSYFDFEPSRDNLDKRPDHYPFTLEYERFDAATPPRSNVRRKLLDKTIDERWRPAGLAALRPLLKQFRPRDSFLGLRVPAGAHA